MALVFITGSMDGLGRAAAQSLIGDGHQVVLHAPIGRSGRDVGRCRIAFRRDRGRRPKQRRRSQDRRPS